MGLDLKPVYVLNLSISDDSFSMCMEFLEILRLKIFELFQYF